MLTDVELKSFLTRIKLAFLNHIGIFEVNASIWFDDTISSRWELHLRSSTELSRCGVLLASWPKVERNLWRKGINQKSGIKCLLFVRSLTSVLFSGTKEISVRDCYRIFKAHPSLIYQAPLAIHCQIGQSIPDTWRSSIDIPWVHWGIYQFVKILF